MCLATWIAGCAPLCRAPDLREILTDRCYRRRATAGRLLCRTEDLHQGLDADEVVRVPGEDCRFVRVRGPGDMRSSARARLATIGDRVHLSTSHRPQHRSGVLPQLPDADPTLHPSRVAVVDKCLKGVVSPDRGFEPHKGPLEMLARAHTIHDPYVDPETLRRRPVRKRWTALPGARERSHPAHSAALRWPAGRDLASRRRPLRGR